MDEHAAGLGHQLVEPLESLRAVARLQVDLRTVGARRLDLQRIRVPPHDDERVDPVGCSAVRERLRVVSCRDADHAARAFVIAQRGQLVQHPARLERARALEELSLEEDPRARQLRERRRGEDGGAVQAAGDRLARGEHVLAGDRQVHSHARIISDAGAGWVTEALRRP